MMVPSAWETRKRFVEEGTQRTEVQGELEILPYKRSMICCILNKARRKGSHLLVQSAVSLGERV